MAFLQTNATNTDDLMNTITAFMASNGYTLVRTQTETVNTKSVKTVTMQCPDNTYITFMSTNTMDRPYPATSGQWEDYYQTPFTDEGYTGHKRDYPALNAFHGRYVQGLNTPTVAPTDTAQYERPWLGAIRHITYDASKDWHQQPDAKRLYQNAVDGYYGAGNANTYSAIVAGDNVPNVFIFINTNPDCIHIVTEYKAAHFSHMTIGNLDKSHNFVGGEYIVGSCNSVDSQADYFGYLPLNIGTTRCIQKAPWFFGGVRCEGNGTAWYNGEDEYAMKGWGRVWMTTGVHVARDNDDPMCDINQVDKYIRPNHVSDYVRGLPCVQGLTGNLDTEGVATGNRSWIGSTFDKVTGQAAPIPLTSWCEHETTGAVYLGSWSHVGVVHMGSLGGKEELVIGGDTYQVFPMNTLKPNGNDGMSRDGVAWTSSTYNEINPRPDGHMFGLGLVIRKTV